MTSVNVGEGRDPAKRKVKPVEAQSLLDFDLEGESSDDSDFRIEDHPEESDDYSINSDDEQKKHGQSESSDDSDDSDEEENKTKQNSAQEKSLADLLEKAKNKDFKYPGDLANVLICAACLGSRSDDYNEIVECDGCGITVHEGCYGVSDVTSESSTVSSASTEPWFCEACKAGVSDPSCELCPNSGGIFKETEVGAWVHLVCALYIPGVAFSDVERLSGVTLFEMAYVRWGARACALCCDAGAARAGVCVGCDAGLCRTFFHVTCGQREGLLAEAHSSEAEQADPFYAHCRLHGDRSLAASRRRAWLALQLRAQRRKQELREKVSGEEKKRIERKLLKHRRKYNQIKENRNPPWVPTQKMARMLYSSASAMRKFQRKAECMGIDTHALEFQSTQMAALKDINRRWHVQPAFSVEFVGYYLERNSRVSSLRLSLEKLTKENEKLVAGEVKLQSDYDEALKANTAALSEFTAARDRLQKVLSVISTLCPTKTLPTLDEALVLTHPPPSTPKLTPQHVQNRGMGVAAGSLPAARPTAAALKQGVGFPLAHHLRPPSVHAHAHAHTHAHTVHSALPTDDGTISSRAICPVCGLHGDAQMMAACDTCKQHYHLHCTTPPLQKPPKKTKLYGWQCSECDKSSESEADVMKEKLPRRSRIRYSKDGAIITAPQSPSSTDITPPHQRKTKTTLKPPPNTSPIKVTIKPFEFTSDDDNEIKKKDKKIRKRFKTTDSESNLSLKKLKRSFTSPALTNTPLMSITPIVADSPNDSHNENSNQSATVAKAEDQAPNTFTSILNDKERDTKTIETSIETTLANLSSDIATYKANRKRRKEKHRSRYSPDFVRSPSKHKHKRKKKQHDLDSPTHIPRITIKIKPIQKPDGSFDKQIFYVPSDNDAGPSQTTPEKQVGETVDSPVALTSPVLTAASMREGSGRARGSVTAAAAGALAPLTTCDVCLAPGQLTNLVRCDECAKRYHLACLEPPLTKNPKKRGYSWHCADCDPTDVEDNAK